MAAIIEVEGLTKRYGSKRAVNNVSFQVEEGEVFGFLGPNGAGKTTTIRTLMALLRADSGTAQIAGLYVRSDAHGVLLVSSAGISGFTLECAD